MKYTDPDAVMRVVLLLFFFSLTTMAGDFNIRDFGAKGDKTTNDRDAIQKTIDTCAAAGGGTVRVPQGEYLSGMIRLTSKVNLHLEKGATIYASKNPEDYKGSSKLIFADGAENISVTGEGTLHGQATGDLGKRWGAPDKADFRTVILLFQNCTNVTLRGFHVLYSDAWTLHLKRCEGVIIEDISIENNYRRLNSDGIDPNSCRNVRIRRCNIKAGDDAIVLKSTEPFPCENIEISDCILESSTAAFKLGTESHGDFRNIVIRDCVIKNSPVGIGFFLKDGAIMENVTAANLKMEICGPTVHDVVPLYIDIERRNPDSKVGRIRNVTFRDIDIQAGSGILIQGMPESPIENLTLSNITLCVEKPDDYVKREKPVGGRRTTKDERDTLFARLPSYAALAYIKGLKIDHVEVRIGEEAFKQYVRSALTMRHVDGGTIRKVTRTPGAETGNLPVIDIQSCTGLVSE
ncbi:MAG: glycoside hydrolase family 28 protein [Kiritimatiellae bacterium]|nr:glycoside hydrolase family 28 protein [Kiritimatiellia bacterium]MDD5519693.1 glycoside hydrolase family 28 protein [Kiritimatiellia bacterium]